jgi:NAD(P)-dependent dehydrogenase (short-subunit alcohol dehydrogenase family)
MQFRLNPVTLVTGAGSGIGAACALDMAKKSHGGLVLADMDEAALALVADEIDAAGAAPERLSTMVVDAGNAARWAEATQFMQSQYGRLDWAVVNASAAKAAPVEESDLVDWGPKTVAHLESAIITLQALMTLIGKNTQGGAIVVIAGAAAIKPEADAKSAPGLLQVVRAASQEGAPNNVRINAIAPGGPETPMWAEMPLFQDLVKEAGNEQGAFDRIAQLPLRAARYAQGGDVARLVSLLLTDATSVTGATVVVDGSYTL